MSFNRIEHGEGGVGSEFKHPSNSTNKNGQCGTKQDESPCSSVTARSTILHNLAVARTQTQKEEAAVLCHFQKQEAMNAERRIQELIQQQQHENLVERSSSSLCAETNHCERSVVAREKSKLSTSGTSGVTSRRADLETPDDVDVAKRSGSYPVANPDDHPDSFVVVELPVGIVSGDLVQIPISEQRVISQGLENVASLDGSKPFTLTFVVPSTYSPMSEGDRFLLVNISLRNGSRLIMPHPTHIPMREDCAMPRQTSPRKMPLQIASEERRRSKVPSRQSKGSRIGESYQVGSIPPWQGSQQFQLKLQLLQSSSEPLNEFVRQYETSSEQFCELVYDPKVENTALPKLLHASRPGKCHSGWSVNDRAVFHRVMIRSMKNFPLVARATKKRIANVLEYYYGSYKQTKEYKVFKATCPKHADDYILCRVCKKERADITCDLCTDAYHLKCLQPLLHEVPLDEVWHCMCCKDEERRTRSSLFDRKNPPAKDEGSHESTELAKSRPHLSEENIGCLRDVSSSTEAVQHLNSSIKTTSHVTKEMTNIFRNEIRKTTAKSLDGSQMPVVEVKPEEHFMFAGDVSSSCKQMQLSESGLKASSHDSREVTNVIKIGLRKRAAENQNDRQKNRIEIKADKSGILSAKKTKTKAASSSSDLNLGLKDGNSEAKVTSHETQNQEPSIKAVDKKNLSDGDTSDEEDDKDAAKLGRPEYITKKSDLSFFGDVRFHLPSPNVKKGDCREDDGIPWKIQVGDILAFRIDGANPPSYISVADCANSTKQEMKKIWDPFEVPWSPGEVLSICWVPEGVNMTTFRQHLNKKVDPNRANYYSVKVDLDDVIIEVRWLYRSTEIQNSLRCARSKKKQSPTKATKEKFCSPDRAHMSDFGFFKDSKGNLVDEVWETDHVDELDLSSVLGPIRLFSSADQLSDAVAPVKSTIHSECEVTPARLVCRKFYFAQRMKESDFPMWIGSSRLERGIHLSPRLKKAPAYRSMRSKRIADDVSVQNQTFSIGFNTESGEKKPSNIVL